jgi:phytoene dehydrogenase-like protein
VTGVLEKDGRAAGVELADGAVAEAEQVVAGVHPLRLRRLTERLLDTEGDVQPGTGPRPGRCTVLLALRGAREAGAVHRTVVHAADRAAELDFLTSGSPGSVRPTVTVLRPDDPALRPDDAHESVVLSAVVPTDAGWDRPDRRDGFADVLVAAAEAAIPGLGERLLWREVRTPGHGEEETGFGGVSAPALAAGEGRFLHPANTTRLPGLYRVGRWSHPGGGLPHAGMSGALVAGLIVEGPEFRGSQ